MELDSGIGGGRERVLEQARKVWVLHSLLHIFDNPLDLVRMKGSTLWAGSLEGQRVLAFAVWAAERVELVENTLK